MVDGLRFLNLAPFQIGFACRVEGGIEFFLQYVRMVAGSTGTFGDVSSIFFVTPLESLIKE